MAVSKTALAAIALTAALGGALALRSKLAADERAAQAREAQRAADEQRRQQEEARRKEQERRRAVGELVAIPGGTFSMGSNEGEAHEGPPHSVTVAPFWMDRTEVVVEGYAQCVEAGACKPFDTLSWKGIDDEPLRVLTPTCNWNKPGREKHPMNCVDWEQARAYCKWAGKRLPTEAEWEFAATGGGERKFPWGDEPPAGSRLNACGKECAAWYQEREFPASSLHGDDDAWANTAPAGSFPAGQSRHGLLDLAGNVREWVEDVYCGRYEGFGHLCGDERVFRGGGWSSSNADDLRASARDSNPPASRHPHLGFRCASSSAPP